MTRRIAMAILLTVWAALAAAGATAYLTTREVLLDDLDATLVERASRLPELLPPRPLPSVSLPAAVPTTVPTGPGTRAGAGGDSVDAVGMSGDGGRYVIESEGDERTIPRVAGGDAGALYEPQLESARSWTSPGGQHFRTVTLWAYAPPRGDTTSNDMVRVRVTYSGRADALHRLLDQLLWTLVAVGAVAGVLAAAVAYHASRLALHPLREVARVVGSVSERQLDRRVPVESLPPELMPMGRRLNEMLARLQEAFALRRRFLADASHELRTPVAALLTGLEIAAGRERTADAYRAALRSAAVDASHLRHLVERLMEQVRSERFADEGPAELVDVADVLAAAAGPALTLARARGIAVRTSCPAGLRARTRPARLRGIVENLLSNAVEYNRPGGTVTLTAGRAVDGVEVTVRDTGLGMTPAELTRAFEPFYRGDASRGGGTDGGPAARGSDEAGHLGLGLSLVRTHVEALGGRCHCRSTPGEGTEFRIELPDLPDDPVPVADPGSGHNPGTWSEPAARAGGWPGEEAATR